MYYASSFLNVAAPSLACYHQTPFQPSSHNFNSFEQCQPFSNTRYHRTPCYSIESHDNDNNDNDPNWNDKDNYDANDDDCDNNNIVEGNDDEGNHNNYVVVQISCAATTMKATMKTTTSTHTLMAMMNIAIVRGNNEDDYVRQQWLRGIVYTVSPKTCRQGYNNIEMLRWWWKPLETCVCFFFWRNQNEIY